MLRHLGLVRAQLRRLTRGDHAWADDLAQETFLQAWRKLDQFRGCSRFSTWLFQIAYSAFLQSLRSQQSRLQREKVLAHKDFPPDEVELHTLRLDLSEALMQLPDPQRVALLHCYHLDLSHEEAAQVLGLPIGTVKSLVARGKRRLKELLSAWHSQSLAPPMACGDEREQE